MTDMVHHPEAGTIALTREEVRGRMSEKEELVRKMRLLCNAMGQMHDELLGCRVAPLIRGLEPFDELVQDARSVLGKAFDDLDSIVSYLVEEIEKEPTDVQ